MDNLLSLIDRLLDVLIIFCVLGIFLLLLFKGKSKSMLIFSYICLIWGTALFWTTYLPDKISIYLGDNSPYHGYMLTLGGLLYGLPIAILSFLSFLYKRSKEKNN
jgi:hypothetical protein